MNLLTFCSPNILYGQMCHLNYHHCPISDSTQAKTWANSNQFAEAILMVARDVTMMCGYQHIAFEIICTAI